MVSSSANELGYRAFRDLAELVHDQPNCHWALAIFRADGYLNTPDQRFKAARALRLTRQTLERRLCPRKWNYRMVAYWGGEPTAHYGQEVWWDDVSALPGSGAAPHVHAFVEIPPRRTRAEVEVFATKYWKNYLRDIHGRDIKSARVLTKDYKLLEKDEQGYFARREGPTFSWGLEKVILDCTWLTTT